MALLDTSGGISACPKCGAGGPYNFKYEQVTNLTAAPGGDDNTFLVSDVKRVVVCRACKHVVTVKSG